MIITLDGPAGTGKSTVSQALAERLGVDFLDTGAMYRAVGLAAIRRQINLEDQDALTSVARQIKIDFDWTRKPPTLVLNGEGVSHLIRSAEVTNASSYVAAVPGVRQVLVEQQQRIGREHPNLVTEGRDQGSVVFPDAQFKFYLDATPQERARRRVNQLAQRGETADYNEILAKIIERDHRDSSRSVGPLSIPTGAEVVDTTHLTQEQVIQHLIDRVRVGSRP